MDEEPDIAGLPGRRKRSPGCATVVLVAALTSVVASAATTWALQRYGLEWTGLPANTADADAQDEGERVSVPSLRGLSLETARQVLESRGLTLDVDAEEPHADVPAGSVAEQQPSGGTAVDPGRTVSLVVSTGPNEVEVPDVVGMTRDEAERRLEEAELAVGEVDEAAAADETAAADEAGAEGEPGTVTASDPAAGTKVARGTSVALTTTPGGVEVPKVVGMRYGKARDALEDAGLAVGGVRRIYDERRGPHVVLRQGTDPETTVASGTEIDVVVNQGE